MVEWHLFLLCRAMATAESRAFKSQFSTLLSVIDNPLTIAAVRTRLVCVLRTRTNSWKDCLLVAIWLSTLVRRMAAFSFAVRLETSILSLTSLEISFLEYASAAMVKGLSMTLNKVLNWLLKACDSAVAIVLHNRNRSRSTIMTTNNNCVMV